MTSTRSDTERPGGTSSSTTCDAGDELFSGGFFADPYPTFAAVRAAEPVRELALPEGRTWLLTRYDDVRAALVDPRLSKDWRYTLPAEHRADQLPAAMPVLLMLDPPDHTRLRKLVSRSFTARRMNALVPRIEEITQELLDELPAEGPVDLMRAYASAIPVRVICELLGVPVEEREQFVAWSAPMAEDVSPEEQMTGINRLAAYLTGLIERKRTEPDDALLSSLLAVSDEDGDRLSPEELVAMATLLLIAGHETTVNLIGNGVLALLTHPEQRARLRDDPDLITGAVEEVLRFESPVAHPTTLYTRTEVSYSGVTIPAGSRVLLSLSAANRDPGWVDDPDRFDIGRRTSSVMSFGHGIHHCLGAPLARAEGRVAIGRLIAQRPDLALAVAPSDLVHRRSTMVRSLTRLPVVPGAPARDGRG